MHFLTDALLGSPLKITPASPLIPAIVGGCLLLIIAVCLIARGKKRNKKIKSLYQSSEYGMELDADAIKKQSKAKFAYERGYKPGKMPSTAFLDPERLGNPHEIIKVRETYRPSMQLPEQAPDRQGKAVKSKNARIALSASANPYMLRTPNAVAPLAIPVTEELKRPVLTPVPELPAYKMPVLPRRADITPLPPNERPMLNVGEKPVRTPVQMPKRPVLNSIPKLPDLSEYYKINAAYEAEQKQSIQKQSELPPVKIIDREGELTVSPDMLEKIKAELKEELQRELHTELESAIPKVTAAVAVAPAAAPQDKSDAGKNTAKGAMLDPVVRLSELGEKPKLKSTIRVTPVTHTKPIVVRNKKTGIAEAYSISEAPAKPLEIKLQQPVILKENESKVKVKLEKRAGKSVAKESAPKFDENCMLTPDEIYIDELPIEIVPDFGKRSGRAVDEIVAEVGAELFTDPDFEFDPEAVSASAQKNADNNADAVLAFEKKIDSTPAEQQAEITEPAPESAEPKSDFKETIPENQAEFEPQAEPLGDATSEDEPTEVPADTKPAVSEAEQPGTDIPDADISVNSTPAVSELTEVSKESNKKIAQAMSDKGYTTTQRIAMEALMKVRSNSAPRTRSPRK